MTAYWVIECRASKGGPSYYAGPGNYCSSVDHAYKFLSKMSAACYLSDLGNALGMLSITEHAWGP